MGELEDFNRVIEYWSNKSQQPIKRRIKRADEIVIRLYEMRKFVFLGAILMQILRDYLGTYYPDHLAEEDKDDKSNSGS